MLKRRKRLFVTLQFRRTACKVPYFVAVGTPAKNLTDPCGRWQMTQFYSRTLAFEGALLTNDKKQIPFILMPQFLSYSVYNCRVLFGGTTGWLKHSFNSSVDRKSTLLFYSFFRVTRSIEQLVGFRTWYLYKFFLCGFSRPVSVYRCFFASLRPELN